MAVHAGRGASYLAIQTIATNAVVVVSFAILARLISPEQMGIWTVLSLVIGLAGFATLSIDQATTKFVAEEMSRGNRNASASIFYQSMRLTLIIAVILGLVVFFGAHTLSATLLGNGDHAILFIVLALDVVLGAGPLPMLSALLYGLQKFKELAIIGVILNGILRQVLIIGLIIVLHNFVGLVIGWVISDLATALAYTFYGIRSIGAPKFDYPMQKLLNFSWPLYIGNIATFAQNWFDRAMLVAFVPLAVLGIYNVSVTAFGVLIAVISSVTGMLLPVYTDIQTRGGLQTLQEAVRQGSRYVSFVAIPLGLGLMVTAKPALALLVGAAYIEGAYPLMILCLAFAIGVIGSVVAPILLTLNETRVSSAITIVSIAISVGVALILMPLYGMVGAAIARGATMLFLTGLGIIAVSRRITLRLDLEALIKAFAASIAMVTILAVIQMVIYSRFLLPLYWLVGIVAYLVALRLLRAVKPQDMEFIRKYFGRRLAFVAGLMEKILIGHDVRQQ